MSDRRIRCAGAAPRRTSPTSRGSVLVRVDFNVPLHDGVRRPATVADDFRIRRRAAHHRVAPGRRGRGDGLHPPRAARRARPTRAGSWTRCASGCPAGPGVELLENLRFDPGEKANDPAFVEKLVDGFDAYVNDAFGAAHRAHASVVGPPQFLPERGGPALRRRRSRSSGGILEQPGPALRGRGGRRQGGRQARRAQGPGCTRWTPWWSAGGMAFTFLAAQGHDIGGSLVDRDRSRSAAELLDSGAPILLPTDIVALEPGGDLRLRLHHGPQGSVKVMGPTCPTGGPGLDIGPETAAAFAEAVAGGGHRAVERPYGRLRGPALRRGHAGRGRGGGRTAPASRWSAVATAPRASTSSGWPTDRLHLHRWRGVPRAPRVRRPAGPRRAAAGAATPPATAPGERRHSGPRRPLVSGNWKMHLDHLEAHPRRA